MNAVITDLVKNTSNDLMRYIKHEKDAPGILPTERILSDKLEVSRSTLSKSFILLEEKGILSKDEKSRLILRKPRKSDFFKIDVEEKSRSEFVEKFILSELSKYTFKPGDYFSELELAKKSNTNTITVREALLKISKTGLIKKQPRQRWQVVELTKKRIVDLVQFRSVLEMTALTTIFNVKQPEEVTPWAQLILRNHRVTLNSDQPQADLLELEIALHKGLVDLANNEYLKEAYHGVFSLIQYHLGQPGHQRRIVEKTLEEHINILEAIVKWDQERATKALNSHLEEAGFYILSVHDKII